MMLLRSWRQKAVLFLCLGVLGLVTLSFRSYESSGPFMTLSHESGSFTYQFLDCVEACIEHSDAIPRKEGVLAALHALREDGVFLESAQDEPRVKFVQLQGAVEHVLACAQALGGVHNLVAVIHTPTPCTPLCTVPNEEPSAGLLDPSIAHDMEKLLTVRSRAQIVRDYLHNGGNLYVVYPRGGLERRTLEQQDVYQLALRQFPEHLFDWVLDADFLADDKVGATYLFSDRSGEVYAFSIQGPQANNPRQDVEWGLWFGAVSDYVIGERVADIFNYLDSLSGPDVRTQFGL